MNQQLFIFAYERVIMKNLIFSKRKNNQKALFRNYFCKELSDGTYLKLLKFTHAYPSFKYVGIFGLFFLVNLNLYFPFELH